MVLVSAHTPLLRERKSSYLAAGLVLLSALALTVAVVAMSSDSDKGDFSSLSAAMSSSSSAPQTVSLFGAGDMGEDRELDAVFKLVGAEEDELKANPEDLKNTANLVLSKELTEGEEDKHNLDKDAKMEKKVKEEQDQISNLIRSAQKAMDDLTSEEAATETKEENLEHQIVSPSNTNNQKQMKKGGKNNLVSQRQQQTTGKIAVKNSSPKHQQNVHSVTTSSSSQLRRHRRHRTLAQRPVHQVMADAAEAASAGSAASAAAPAASSATPATEGGAAAPAASGEAHGSATESGEEEHIAPHVPHKNDPVLFFHGFWAIVFFVCMLLGALGALKIIHSY